MLFRSTITISSGQLRQIIEGAQFEGGVFTLSWSGTAQGRVNGGAFSASPLTVSGLAAGVDVTIEFGAGTLGKVQFEPGAYATRFEARPLSLETLLCQRYCQFHVAGVLGSLQLLATAAVANASVSLGLTYPIPMRATPT